MSMIPVSIPSHSLLQWLQGPRVGRLALVVNLLLVLWLTWLLAQLTWRLLTPGDPATTGLQMPVTAAPVMESRPAVPLGQVIGQLHLFGESTQAPVAAQETVVPRDAPDTRLKLILRGLFTADVTEEALAIIADPGGDEKPYRIGDPLPGGAELKEIYADRIILSRAGRYETLRLPQEGIEGGGRAPAATRGNTGAVEDPGQVLRQYRQSLRENPQSLISLVRPLPVQENGKFVGFRLLPGQERGFLNKLGLRPGDIVTAINGVALDSPANGMQALQVLQNESSVQLKIRRGRESMALNFEIPQ